MAREEEDLLEERHQSWVGEGVRLEIIAQALPDGQWCLSVINERGTVATWLEFFESAELAMEAARKAIEEEGVEDFVSTEGFEYLNKDLTSQ